MKNKKIKKEPIYELLEHLYFVEGLEELPWIYEMKSKHLKGWGQTTGRKLKDIFWALILEKKPEHILKELLKDAK